jgi:hypothetical protein
MSLKWGEGERDGTFDREEGMADTSGSHRGVSGKNGFFVILCLECIQYEYTHTHTHHSETMYIIKRVCIPYRPHTVPGFEVTTSPVTLKGFYCVFGPLLTILLYKKKCHLNRVL